MSTRAIQWTLERAAAEFGCSRATVKAGLVASGVEVKKGRGHTFTTRQVVAAIFGDIKHERLLKTRTERELLEIEKSEKEGRLVELDAVLELIANAFLPVRQRLLALPSEACTRCNPTDPQFARQALDAWVDQALATILGGLPTGTEERTRARKPQDAPEAKSAVVTPRKARTRQQAGKAAGGGRKPR